jgi:magnesium-transporting ATPase (P-type)
MCTGDSIDTAKAISKNAGILSDQDPDSSCMTGKEFREAIGGIVKDTDSVEKIRDL